MSASAPALRPVPFFPILARQFQNGLISAVRIPAFSVTSLLLPVVFFVFFGLAFAKAFAGGAGAAYMIASFGAYAVSSTMVFNFGIGVAMERGLGVDRLLRATPLPPIAYLLAKVLVALLISLLSLAMLITFGIVFGGVREDPATWLKMVALLLAGSIPFIGLGFAIGYMAGANAAPAVVNLIYSPMSFASGLFVPLRQMPDFIQKVAHYLPTYHYGQLAWYTVGKADESLAIAGVWLAGFTVLFFAIALRAYRKEDARNSS